MSGANQYSVRPSASVSRVTPPTVVVFKVTEAPAAAAAGAPALATATPSRANAATETAPTAVITSDIAASARASSRMPGLARRPDGRAAGAMSAARPSIANAATSISPAAIPALVRTSLNPNSPIRTASRYALSVDSANTAHGRGDQPAARQQRRGRQDEARDELHQEQPADRGDRPVPGQVQAQVDAGRPGQQRRSRQREP